jgi:putative transposase
MPSTHLELSVHIVFSTKERRPLLPKSLLSDVHSFLGGCLRTSGVFPEMVGGVEDHIHLLAGLRATHRVCYVVREIKTASSKWIHQELHLRDFDRQDGYGAFSVSSSMRETVRRYIEDQERHHERMTFQEEYLALLKAHGVRYDERYLW